MQSTRTGKGGRASMNAMKCWTTRPTSSRGAARLSAGGARCGCLAQAVGRQELLGDVRGLLLVQVDRGVHLLHRLGGELRAHRVECVLEAGALRVEDLLGHDRGDVLEAEDELRVLQ